MRTPLIDQRRSTSLGRQEAGNERGAGLVEYALLVALISIVCLSALQVFGVTNGGSINNTADTYASATN